MKRTNGQQVWAHSRCHILHSMTGTANVAQGREAHSEASTVRDSTVRGTGTPLQKIKSQNPHSGRRIKSHKLSSDLYTSAVLFT
jgi:Zn-finger protein